MAFGGFLHKAVISYQLLVGKREVVVLFSSSGSAARTERGMATLLAVYSFSPLPLPLSPAAGYCHH